MISNLAVSRPTARATARGVDYILFGRREIGCRSNGGRPGAADGARDVRLASARDGCAREIDRAGRGSV